MSACREWQGATGTNGYGLRTPKGKRTTQGVHRWVIEQIGFDQFGTLWQSDPKQIVMHLCDNPPCYRYDHLRLGTPQDNHDDAVRKGRKPKAGCGTYSKYSAGCRCDGCRTANTIYKRKYRR